MQKKRRKVNKRPTTQRTHSVPPDMNYNQAGVSVSGRKAQPAKKPVKRRKSTASTRNTRRRVPVEDNTYHGRRRRTSEVKPFSIKEARRQARREKRRKYRRHDDGRTADIIYKVLICGAVLAIILFTLGVFFGVEEINTENSNHYTQSEVVRVSGIERGDKILFINRGKVYDNIKESLPFIRSVRIKIKFPTTVTIVVTEREPVAKITAGGFEYIIASDGVLLEKTVFSSKYTLPSIICEAPSESIEGQKLTFENEVTGVTIDTLLEKLASSQYASKIDNIDIEKAYDISFTYEDRFTIRIGDTTDIDKKIQMLTEVIKRLGSEKTGIIDVRNPDLVRYREQ